MKKKNEDFSRSLCSKVTYSDVRYAESLRCIGECVMSQAGHLWSAGLVHSPPLSTLLCVLRGFRTRRVPRLSCCGLQMGLAYREQSRRLGEEGE